MTNTLLQEFVLYKIYGFHHTLHLGAMIKGRICWIKGLSVIRPFSDRAGF